MPEAVPSRFHRVQWASSHMVGGTRDHQIAPLILIRQQLMWMVMDRHERWLAECQKIGFKPSPRRYSEGTVTSEDAAAQVGCDVAQIAKSIVFQGEMGGVVVITSGANKVDRKRKLKDLLGFKPKIATASYVLQETGYEPGGVPPFGHKNGCVTFIDQDLFHFELVWGAAGSSDTVFPISPIQLLRFTGGIVADVRL